jgi:hypothetical protein
MNIAKKASTSIIVPILALTMIVNLASCGTILYPNRQGQKVGQIDPAVAILDAVGLLFFIIPGVIAFAVDFSNHTIYLPSGHSSRSSNDESSHRYTQIRVDQKMDMASIEKVIRAETGRSVSLQQSNVQAVRLDSLAALDSKFALYEANDHVALAQ